MIIIICITAYLLIGSIAALIHSHHMYDPSFTTRAFWFYAILLLWPIVIPVMLLIGGLLLISMSNKFK